jgi:peptidoglycan-associated lipoprotein
MMRRAFLCVILVVFAMVSVTGCRSRRAVPPPQTQPPVERVEVPATPVSPPSDDFVTPDTDVMPNDLSELTRMAHERGWISDAFFAFDESTLDASARAALTRSAEWLRQNTQYAIRLEGHCDERGTEQYNFALGERRASAAADFLAAQGVDRSRISTVSYGESRPFSEGSHEAAWAQNRRAHLVIVARR